MNEKSVLYIEDNFENRLLVKRTLEAEGYSVLEAADGPSGLKMASESRPDLILLDISLPEMDGYDLARRFADFPHLDGVPVLAVTANVMKGDRERALGAGCDGYIPKPINIDRLPGQIEAALLRARSLQKGPEFPSEEPLPVPGEVDMVPSVEAVDRAAPGVPEIDWSDIFEGEAVWSSEVARGGHEAEVLAIESDEVRVSLDIAGDDGGGRDVLGERPVETLAAGPGKPGHAEIDASAGPVEESLVEAGPGGLGALPLDGEAAGDEPSIDVLDRRLAELLEASPFGPEILGEAVSAIAGQALADEVDADRLQEVAVEAPTRDDEGEADQVGAPEVETPELRPSLAEAAEVAETEAAIAEDQVRTEEVEAPETLKSVIAAEAIGEIAERQLPEESLAELVRHMNDLSAELGAEVVLLAQGDRVLASVGRMPARRMEQLTEVLARGFRAADSVASLLGCDRGCSEQITCIGGFQLHARAVDADLAILTAVRDSVPLGALRLWVKRSAARVQAVVSDADGVSPG